MCLIYIIIIVFGAFFTYLLVIGASPCKVTQALVVLSVPVPATFWLLKGI